eukprot:3722764-Prymnesium_polylepis.1
MDAAIAARDSVIPQASSGTKRRLPHLYEQAPAAAIGGVQIDEFIAKHGLDERVSSALRELPAEAQQLVLDAPMENARNASALVWSRIRSTNVEHVAQPQPNAA